MNARWLKNTEYRNWRECFQKTSAKTVELLSVRWTYENENNSLNGVIECGQKLMKTCITY